MSVYCSYIISRFKLGDRCLTSETWFLPASPCTATTSTALYSALLRMWHSYWSGRQGGWVGLAARERFGSGSQQLQWGTGKKKLPALEAWTKKKMPLQLPLHHHQSHTEILHLSTSGRNLYTEGFLNAAVTYSSRYLETTYSLVSPTSRL